MSTETRMRLLLEVSQIQHQQCWTALKSVHDTLLAVARRSREVPGNHPIDVEGMVMGLDAILKETDPYAIEPKRKLIEALTGAHKQLVVIDEGPVTLTEEQMDTAIPVLDGKDGGER